MGKLILEMQVSLDSFMAGPEGQTDWMVWNWGPVWTWDKALQKFHSELTLATAHLLISRQMAEEGFIEHWKLAASKKNEQGVFAKHLSDTPKTVISTTLTESDKIPGGWENVKVSNDLLATVTLLKQKEKGNILVYGGATLVSNLLKAALIDELYLLVNPVSLGEGMSAFRNLQQFQLKEVKSFSSGIALLHYST